MAANFWDSTHRYTLHVPFDTPRHHTSRRKLLVRQEDVQNSHFKDRARGLTHKQLQQMTVYFVKCAPTLLIHTPTTHTMPHQICNTLSAPPTASFASGTLHIPSHHPTKPAATCCQQGGCHCCCVLSALLPAQRFLCVGSTACCPGLRLPLQQD